MEVAVISNTNQPIGEVTQVILFLSSTITQESSFDVDVGQVQLNRCVLLRLSSLPPQSREQGLSSLWRRLLLKMRRLKFVLVLRDHVGSCDRDGRNI